MRLGDLDALHDFVMEEMRRNPLNGHIERMMHRHEHESFLRDIRLAPTIDAALVVHGCMSPAEQPKKVLLDCKCMKCGSLLLSTDRFCSSCGAKMDGGDGNGI